MTYTSPDTTDSVWIGSFGVMYKVPSAATPSGVALVEHVLGPKQLGAPFHRHSREDEISYVLEGTLTVQQGDEIETATPGGIVVKPRNVFHAFWNSRPAPVRFLEIIAPGAFADYFRKLAPLLSQEGPPDPAGITALAASYGVEFDFASMPELLKRHGLYVA